jgi:probable rRNA maturation factor
MQFPNIDDPNEDDDAAEREHAIEFFNEDLDFEPPTPERLREWLQAIAARLGQSIAALSYIFCSDAYLHRMNVEYLQHDTLTDVITFPYADEPIEGDVFISIDRIRDNAATFGVPMEHELQRVMAHGLLHLCGFGDKSPAEKKQMTEQENLALELWQTMA